MFYYFNLRYLFELLQNAVDDGAMHVELSMFDNASQSRGRGTKEDIGGNLNSKFRNARGTSVRLFFSTTGLVMRHNGRRFTPLDVLGLVSLKHYHMLILLEKQIVGKILELVFLFLAG